jgi:hypothetical protein
MAGYLEEYGVADARRAKLIRWSVIAVLAAAVLAGVLYFFLPIFRAKSQVRTLLGHLSRHDYQAAYRAWGCRQPCRDYSFQEFLRDWGPKSAFANASEVQVLKARPCGNGIIVSLALGGGWETWLQYRPSDQTLSFWPWHGCPAKFEAPAGAAPAPAP